MRTNAPHWNSALVAAGLGLEPRLPGPKPGVLPLDDPAISLPFGITNVAELAFSFNEIQRAAMGVSDTTNDLMKEKGKFTIRCRGIIMHEEKGCYRLR